MNIILKSWVYISIADLCNQMSPARQREMTKTWVGEFYIWLLIGIIIKMHSHLDIYIYIYDAPCIIIRRSAHPTAIRVRRKLWCQATIHWRYHEYGRVRSAANHAGDPRASRTPGNLVIKLYIEILKLSIANFVIRGSLNKFGSQNRLGAEM